MIAPLPVIADLETRLGPTWPSRRPELAWERRGRRPRDAPGAQLPPELRVGAYASGRVETPMEAHERQRRTGPDGRGR